MSNLKLEVLLKAVDQATRPFKAIQNASKSLSGDIRSTQDSLKALNAQAAKIDGFRKSSAQLAVTGQALKKAKEDAERLAVAYRNTANPTAAQTRLMESAKRAASELQNKHNTLRLSVQRQRQELNAAGISTRNLAAEQRRLHSSTQQANATLLRQRESLARLSQQQQKLDGINNRYQSGKNLANGVRNGGAVALGAATTALYAGARFIAPGMGFDKEMSGTQAILGLDKSDKKLAEIRKQARDIGGTTAFSPGDVARTQGVLARSGYNADQILGSTESTVNLSLASGLDIADAADIVTNMQSAFNIPMDEIKRVSDVMTKGFTSSNTNLMELGEAMKYVAPIAKAAGASIEDTTAMLGVLADNGIKGSMAGTGASAMFSRLQAPTGQSPAALRELGITTRDKKGNMLPIKKILTDINTSFKKNKLGTAQQAEYLKVIFGEEAMKGAVKLVEAAGNGRLGEKKAALDNSAGSAQRVAGIQTDNLDGDLKNLQSAFEDLQIEVFDKEDSSLRRLTQSANKWLTEVGNWVKKNPELTQTLVTVAGSLAALVGALGAIGLIAWPVITGFNALIAGAGYLGTAFSIAGGTISAVFGAISLPVVAAVAVIVAAVLVIRKYWEPISAFFGGVMEGIKAAFLPVGEALSPFAEQFGWIAEKVKQAWAWFKELIAPVKSTQETLDNCRSAGKAFGEVIGKALRVPLDALNQLRKGIDWVLEKLGVIKVESADIDKNADRADRHSQPGHDDAPPENAPLDNPNPFAPPAEFLTGAGYTPVSAGGGRSYVDQSTHHYQISAGAGLGGQDNSRQIRAELEARDRARAAQQRSRMDND